MDSRKKLILLASLLAVLGVSRMVGKYVNIPGLQTFSRTLGFSPNPAPFGTIRTFPGIELRGTDFVCEAIDGSVKTIRWNHEVMARIDAPMRVRSYFTGLINLFDYEHPGPGPMLLERAMCGESPLKAALGCEGQLRTVEIRYYSYSGESERSRRAYKLACGGGEP